MDTTAALKARFSLEGKTALVTGGPELHATHSQVCQINSFDINLLLASSKLNVASRLSKRLAMRQVATIVLYVAGGTKGIGQAVVAELCALGAKV
jgi:hypothetical protein